MNKDPRLYELARLALLRERQVDRLNADMAARRVVRNRYLGNIERLEKLCQGIGTGVAASPPVISPALCANSAHFKQAVMKMSANHRVDLALHEADMQVAHGALATAIRRHKALDHVLSRARASAETLQRRREQRQQDETAVGTWTRGRK